MNNANEEHKKKALFDAFSILKALKDKGNYLEIANAGVYGKKKALLPWRLKESLEEVSNAKRRLRAACGLLTADDVLKLRQNAVKCSYESRNGNRIFFFEGINGCDRLDYNSDRHWLDDFMSAYRAGDWHSIHDKVLYFRVGDKYYPKSDFLLKDGQVYSKDKYALTNSGELVELSKCLKLDAYYSSYYRSGGKFEATDWLKCNEEEEFECIQRDDDKYVVRVFCYENMESARCSSNRFLDVNYYFTLFKFGKKRYFYRETRNWSSFVLTPELLVNMEYAPTKEHERCWKYFFEEVAKFKNKHGPDCLPKMKEDGKDVSFFIEYNRGAIKTSSIRDKIIKSLCDYNNGNRLSLGGLLNRLEALKAIYKAEMKYESGTKQDD